ncbi:hypothetical protein PCC7418_2930 [Halothece sp. PCC 7418]|uniref:hypothetical protein n=1 Tax=Halothece sp. (strain PCC 7418) TaxID=65093 RepID=UPI0002A08C1A|nr:hypothetical protein [Halothece sp. PCC 7418]AFZ45059.1 hypothetical protein PCC7418_2930 [Halothece sp. PCC 7418]
MKYFFLTAGWTIGRVWEFGGLWNSNSRRRQPYLKPLPISLVENEEKLILYEVEDDVLMVEVLSPEQNEGNSSAIGQVFLKRLISAEQVIGYLAKANGKILNDSQEWS